MKWKHIMDAQPEDGSTIIQLDAPYDVKSYTDGFKSHYSLGMRKCESYGQSWDEFIQLSRKGDWPDPDFWWVYAKDFPFPKEQE